MTNSLIRISRANFAGRKIIINVLEYIEVQKRMKPSTYASEIQNRLLLDGVVHPNDSTSPFEAEKPGALDRQNEYLQAISRYPASKLCFFDESSVIKTVSHQFYGDSSHHLHIREVGVQYLRDNPESFIESNTEHSWNYYLSNMSMQGTWCDALIVQAVAESQPVNIYIIESHENFAEVTLVEPNHLSQQPPATLYLGHVNEVHYVSTVPYSSDFTTDFTTHDQHSNNHLK